MACKHLKTGWRWKNGRVYDNLAGTKLGKEPTTRPCGQCIDCRLDKTKEWAIRSKHEGSLYERNCVITLTYSDEHLPKAGTLKDGKTHYGDGSIVPDHGPEFIKKLRSRIDYANQQAGKPKQTIKTYGCAEYGCNDPRCGRSWCQHNMRPHNHIILFNHDFEDKKLDYKDEEGNAFYTSDILEQTWGMGGCQIMDLNWTTAAYVARYVLKKISGPGAAEYEEKRIKQGRQKHPYGDKLREQTICVAQQKGIAAEWWEQNKWKIHTNDIMYIDGHRHKPTKYYDRKFEKKHPNQFKNIKEKREKELKKYLQRIQQEIKQGIHTNNFQRMDRQRAHERCMEAKAALLKRGLE